MSGTVPLGAAAKSTSARFNLVSLIPSAVLATAIVLLVASGSFSGVPSMHALALRLREVNILIASLLFLAVFSVALILSPFQLMLVRLLEGYWEEVPVLRRLRFIGVEVNRRRWVEILTIKRDDALLARLYPLEPDDLLPTRLGNVLRAAERSAGTQHGFTSPIEMLPRVYPYMSSPLSEAFGDARNELDIACRMSVVLWMLAALSAVVFTYDGAVLATRGALLAIPAAAALLGAVSYRGAVRSAGEYGRFLHYVFDLHRRDLIRALGYEPPRSAQAEIKLIEELTGWLVDGDPAPVHYREDPKQR